MSLVPADDAVVGLEDYNPETDNAGTPRLVIDHDEAMWKDSIGGQKWSKVKVILLGNVKQRVLWPPEMGEEKSKPLCRSLDAKLGQPGEKFPWEAYGTAAQEGPLDCSTCPLSQWGSHPTKDTPWCSEQYTIPLLLQLGEDVWSPTILTAQRSSLGPLKKYVTGFARARQPLFTAVTELTLDPRKRGKTVFAVPVVERVGDTDPREWQDYTATYIRLRDFLHSFPSEEQDEEVTAPTNNNRAPAAADDEVPF